MALDKYYNSMPAQYQYGGNGDIGINFFIRNGKL